MQDAVDEAIRTLQSERPNLFEGDVVKSAGAYYVGLIKILDRKGLCADTDGEELGVTNTNSSNDQFDVLTGLAPASEFPLVRDIDAYHQGIVSIMVGKGYCARADGEEIALKKGPWAWRAPSA